MSKMSHLSHPAPARTSADPADGPTASARPGRRLARRLPVLGGIAAGSVLLLAGPAFAHVSVEPEAAEKGGYATVNFKVPNERDDASTVKLEVNLPTDHPLASVMPQPVPGWKVEVTKSKLDKPMEMHGDEDQRGGPSKITWTADGKGVEPGQFQQFPVSVGQLPEDADKLVFKALQTYDDKEVVRWIEEPGEGGRPGAGEPGAGAEAHRGDRRRPRPRRGCRGRRRQEHRGRRQAHRGRRGRRPGGDTTARVLAVVGIVVGLGGRRLRRAGRTAARPAATGAAPPPRLPGAPSRLEKRTFLQGVRGIHAGAALAAAAPRPDRLWPRRRQARRRCLRLHLPAEASPSTARWRSRTCS